MGCATSKGDDVAAASRSKAITRSLKKEASQSNTIVKLLLLGAGESGKSTFVKQMKILHKNGYSDEERKSFRRVVFANVVQSIVTIVKAMSNLHIEYGDPRRETDANLLITKERNLGELGLTGEIGEALQRLWGDKGIQECFEHSREYQLNDSAEYYFNSIKRLCMEGYLPTDQDILRSRVQTKGVIETRFMYKSLEFRLIDVGGQRNQRKKWIHYFDDVTAILFCVALSAYDLLLAEDEETNRMRESMRLFESICNNNWFEKTAMILFLNKKDLFKKKITKSPLSVCFPEYTGESTYEQTATFIQLQYENLNKHPEKTIYIHFTCATDTSNVKFVFKAVADLILGKVLGEVGF